MEKERISYGVVFTRGGVVRKEFGKQPAYINDFVEKIEPTNGICSTRIRSDFIVYVMGIRNIYLLVYKDAELEKKMIEMVTDAREKTEQSVEGRTPGGIFREQASETKPGEKNKEEEKEVEEESEEENIGWSKWSKPKSFLNVFYQGDVVSEKALQDHFVSKNIALSLSRAMAKEIVQVKKNDERKLAEKVKIKEALRKVILEIMPTLLPDKIESEIEMHKKQGKRPYVFCMVGVNGVGKSTTLSKLCLWLLKNKHRVCVAACDGFRSGAIEQLRKYVERYQNRGHAIHLFEKGYGRDESSIANQAVQYACTNKFDVVLIDTCGRMPGNSSSMLSLSKMIRINKPEKIFYVGEALVGSDSISQISSFNAYIERAGVDRCIDGIIVTKCDTVDDKIGTIVTLAHSVHKPVVFIGVGQKNADLLPFDLEGLCSALDI